MKKFLPLIAISLCWQTAYNEDGPSDSFVNIWIGEQFIISNHNNNRDLYDILGYDIFQAFGLR